MRVQTLFASVALLSVFLTSAFGICSMEHAMPNEFTDHTIINNPDCMQSHCPLAFISGADTYEKFAQIDPNRYLITLPSIDSVDLIYLKKISLLENISFLNKNKAGPKYNELGVSIVSGNLLKAFSRGILHSKIFA